MPRLIEGECAICGSNLRLTFVAAQAEAFSFRDDLGPAGPESSEDVVICKPCKDDFGPGSARARPTPGPPGNPGPPG